MSSIFLNIRRRQAHLWFLSVACLLVPIVSFAAGTEELPERISWKNLPQRVVLDGMTQEEVARQLTDISSKPNWDCIGSLLLPADGALKPILIKAVGRRLGGGRAVLKVNGRLRAAYVQSGVGRAPWHMDVQVGSYKPVDSILQLVESHSEVKLALVTNSAEMIKKSARCTLLDKNCRRYEGLFRIVWMDSTTRREVPAVPHPMRFVIEDSCPNTRGAMVEFFGSRIEMFESINEILNK